MYNIETILLIISSLMFISIFFSKLSSITNIPSFLIFLTIGMIAGREGPGGINFNNYQVAQWLGIIALSFILFSGGLDTKFSKIKNVAISGILLSVFGVIITTVIVTFFCYYLLKIDFKISFLIGAIISSTDASAVFMSLKSKQYKLKQSVEALLELESGSNDPTAVFLTISAITIIITNEINIYSFLLDFFRQMLLGLFIGYGLGKLSQKFINKIKLDYDGIYPVITFALVFFTYSISDVLKGNGFLSVYICGIILGNSNIVHKNSLVRFHDGLSWIMQVTMYVLLGLIVTPSEILNIALYGVVVSFVLILIARPASVHLVLFLSKFKFKEQALISWVGLRGAVPIVLAIFPTIYNISDSSFVFNIVFFVVLTSTLIQGSTIYFVADKLNLLEQEEKKKFFPIELSDKFDSDSELIEIVVPDKSIIINKQIIDLDLPENTLIVLINRNEKYVIPKGDTTILQGDVLLVLTGKENFLKVKEIISEKQKTTA